MRADVVRFVRVCLPFVMGLALCGLLVGYAVAKLIMVHLCPDPKLGALSLHSRYVVHGVPANSAVSFVGRALGLPMDTMHAFYGQPDVGGACAPHAHSVSTLAAFHFGVLPACFPDSEGGCSNTDAP